MPRFCEAGVNSINDVELNQEQGLSLIFSANPGLPEFNIFLLQGMRAHADQFCPTS
jgi:hypothetical protein